MNTPEFVRPVALFIALAVVSPGLRAQDVTVGEPVWSGTEAAPEVMPVPRGKLRPDYPDEMRKTDEIGYVIIFRFLDSTGKNLSTAANGTHVPFQRSVESAFQGWEMRPATRGGRPVNAIVWVPVIFNPKAAGTKAPDAAPRLLAVTPVITTERPTRAGTAPVVRMKVSLDAAGAITVAEPETEVPVKALAAIGEAMKAWRFAPARRAGQPVAAETVVSVLCQPPPRPAQAKTIPAKPVHQVTPKYPIAMQRFGLTGQVLIDFKVDVEGRVRNPVIYQSDNPAFEEPAIKALLEWKFEPATRDGKPVEIKQRAPIVFLLGGYTRQSAFGIESHGDQSKLPPGYQYDTPPKIRGVLVPVYPYAQRREGVKGKAKATMLISPQGRVIAVKVQSADRPEFGLALTAALEGFTFDPALKDGRPVPHLLNFEQEFNDEDLPDDDGDRLLELEKRHPEKIARADKLDATMAPVSRRAPRFPTGLNEAVTEGSAVIECLVDEDGRVRVPRVAEASDPAFGYAAVQAAATWWFEPPKVAGKNVVVRAKIPFAFKSAPAKPAERSATGAEAKPSG